MPRAFIRDGRMRFVLPGYDANDMTLAPNRVVFDSTFVATLPVYMTGLWSGTIEEGDEVTIATFPSLGYVPFATFILREDSSARWRAGPHVNYLERAKVDITANKIVTKVENFADYDQSWQIAWTVYRMALDG